jgi:hypothetical protein
MVNNMKITLELTQNDFEHLTTTSMRWGKDWESKAGRFEPILDNTNISYAWAFAHWVDTYADYILAAAFLKSIAEAHEAAFDIGTGEVVILTDYPGSWETI